VPHRRPGRTVNIVNISQNAVRTCNQARKVTNKQMLRLQGTANPLKKAVAVFVVLVKDLGLAPAQIRSALESIIYVHVLCVSRRSARCTQAYWK